MYGLLPDEIEAKLTEMDREAIGRTLPYVEFVYGELERASRKFGPFKSPLEGQAIIAEEFDEFTQAVRHETLVRAREEAVQLAAMAIRFLVDTE